MPGGPETAAIGPNWDAIKCSLTFCCTRGDYFAEVESNLDSLIHELGKLQDWRENMKGKVAAEMRPNLQEKGRITDWFIRVESAERDVSKVIEEGREEIKKKCSRWFFPKRCCSYNGVGNRVKDKLRALIELRKDGNFEDVVEEKPAAPADELPIGLTVGLSSKLNEAWTWIEDPRVSIIGVYGIGGVGKSTLLKEINNCFCRKSHNFDTVILIEVSKEIDLRKIQDNFYGKLAINEREDWWKCVETDQRAVKIWNLLRSKKFALLLDDIWEPWELADLVKVGVPIDGNKNNSKIIFTCRSELACTRMKANKAIMLEGLDEEAALHLFHSFVGEETLYSHADILELSKRIANKCQGLPLALVVLGRAMAGKRRLWEWEDAVKHLDLSQIPGMDDIFGRLKFSVDSLGDKKWSQRTLKMCFLYCSIFAGNKIRKDDLVEHWIGEGFISKSGNIYDARKEGYSIIEVLKLACLLNSGETDDYISMHDIVRELAIRMWYDEDQFRVLKLAQLLEISETDNFVNIQDVIRESPFRGGDNEDEITLQDPVIVRLSGASRTWATRLSLWGSNSGDKSPSETPLSPKFKSLIIRDSELSRLPIGILKYMATVGVLDLSGNRRLTDLSGRIGAFTHLDYLNLSGTSITNLPRETSNLHKLKILLVDYTANFKHFRKGSISSIQSLKVFSKLTDNESYDDTALLQELEDTKNIRDISVCIFGEEALRMIIASEKLQGSVRRFCLLSSESVTDGTPSLAPVSTLRRMEHLETLMVNDCHRLNFSVALNSSQLERSYRPFFSLLHVSIWHCPAISHLGWLGAAKGLQTLELFCCSQLSEVLSHTQDAGEIGHIFLHVTDLVLGSLPVLTSICSRVLSFPRLKKLSVHNCPQLTQLPFDSNTAKDLKEIKGSRMWWDRLVWQNEDVKEVFAAKFIPV